MPTQAQIQSQATTALTSIEKEIVRHIIGINGRSSSDVYTDSETRLEELEEPQRQLVRALLDDYDGIDNTTVAIAGANDGLNVSFNRDRELIAQQLRRILYPTDLHDPQITSGQSGAGALNFIPVTYANGSAEFD